MGTIAFALALGFAAGVLSGFFGVGGGTLFVPALTLGLGLAQLEAQATSLAAMIPAVVAGAWRQEEHGNVRWRAAAIIGVASVLGVEAGARVAEALSEDALRRLFALLLLAVSAQLAIRALRS